MKEYWSGRRGAGFLLSVLGVEGVFQTFPQKVGADYLCVYDSNYMYMRVFQRKVVRVFQRS